MPNTRRIVNVSRQIDSQITSNSPNETVVCRTRSNEFSILSTGNSVQLKVSDANSKAQMEMCFHTGLIGALEFCRNFPFQSNYHYFSFYSTIECHRGIYIQSQNARRQFENFIELYTEAGLIRKETGTRNKDILLLNFEGFKMFINNENLGFEGPINWLLQLEELSGLWKTLHLQLGIYDLDAIDTVRRLPGVYFCLFGFNGVLLHPTVGIGSSNNLRKRFFVEHIRKYACVHPVTVVYTKESEFTLMEDMVKALLREDYQFLKRVVNKTEDYLLTGADDQYSHEYFREIIKLAHLIYKGVESNAYSKTELGVSGIIILVYLPVYVGPNFKMKTIANRLFISWTQPVFSGIEDLALTVANNIYQEQPPESDVHSIRNDIIGAFTEESKKLYYICIPIPHIRSQYQLAQSLQTMKYSSGEVPVLLITLSPK